jgi:hypothetical protein
MFNQGVVKAVDAYTFIKQTEKLYARKLMATVFWEF